jgi:lysophospholipase L1-like esterase
MMPGDRNTPLRVSRIHLLLAGSVLAFAIMLVLEAVAYLLLVMFPSIADPWAGRGAARAVGQMARDLPVVAQRQELYVEDRTLFWRLAPDVEMQVENTALETRQGPLRWTIRTNDQGFRSPSTSSSGASMRVLTIGDSSTFGFRVGQEEIYPARLARACGARDPARAVHLLNAGVPGYTSYQGKILLRTLLEQYHPHVVTIAFGANDHYREAMSDAERGAWLESGVGRFAYAVGRLNLSRLVAGVALPANGERGPQRDRVSLAEYRTNIEEMIALARQASARVVLLNLTYYAPLYRYILQELSTRWKVPFVDGTVLFDETYERIEKGTAYRDEARAWLEFHDTQVTAVRQVYYSTEFYESHYPTERDWRKFVTLMADPIHPNALGHLVVADALAPLVCHAN